MRLTMTYFDDVTTYDPIDVHNNEYSEINFQKVLKKLAHYEDLEEAGRLIELPCAVGDRIYRINQWANIPIIEMRVIGLLCNDAFIRIDAAAENDLSESCYFLEDFGKTVFLTKEEALAKLKERDEQE